MDLLNGIRENLSYDPETGVFRWIGRTSNAITIGDVAGSVNKRGYRYIRFQRRSHMAHRLAWFFVYGCIPPEIDHRNGHPDDNRINNLRPATNSQNNYNSKSRSGSVSRFKGVYLDKRDGRWFASIMARRRKFYLGRFVAEEEAARAYDIAARQIHGEFARLNFLEAT